MGPPPIGYANGATLTRSRVSGASGRGTMQWVRHADPRPPPRRLRLRRVPRGGRGDDRGQRAAEDAGPAGRRGRHDGRAVRVPRRRRRNGARARRRSRPGARRRARLPAARGRGEPGRDPPGPRSGPVRPRHVDRRHARERAGRGSPRVPLDAARPSSSGPPAGRRSASSPTCAAARSPSCAARRRPPSATAQSAACKAAGRPAVKVIAFADPAAAQAAVVERARPGRAGRLGGRGLRGEAVARAARAQRLDRREGRARDRDRAGTAAWPRSSATRSRR